MKPSSIFTRLFPVLFCLSFIIACEDSNSESDDLSGDSNITYYVDSTSGNDANDGLSESSAWKTITKVNSSDFSDGTQILLKRGETWFETLKPSSNSASISLTFGAYGNGNQPIISGAAELSGWSNVSGNVYQASTGFDNLGNVVVDGSPLTFVDWSTSPTVSSLSAGSFTFDYDNGILYLHLADSSDPGTKTIYVSKNDYAIYLNAVMNLTFQNITVEQAARHCISVESASEIHFENMTIRNCGGERFQAPLNVYVGNGVEWASDTKNSSLKNSTIYQIFDSGATPQLFEADVEIDNITIQGNTFYKCGFNAIEVSIPVASSTNAALSNITISQNKIYDGGKGWSGIRPSKGQGIGVYSQISAGSISGVVIQENEIYENSTDGIELNNNSGTVSILRNFIFENTVNGVEVTDAGSGSDTRINANYNAIYENGDYGMFINAPNANGYELYNNTFAENVDFDLYTQNASGTNYLKNNVFFRTSTFSWVDNSTPTVSSGNADFNLYFATSGTAIAYSGSAFDASSFSTLQGTHGIETNGQYSNPLLDSSAKYKPASNSPAVNAGTNVSLTKDIEGNAVGSSNIDIGAYEQ